MIIKNNNFLRLAFFCFFAFAVSAIFLSCGTIPTEATVSPDLTPTELNQKAQEELDKGYIKSALAYYEILLNRYGQDVSVRTGAEYEIAHIYIKQKKWLEADYMLKMIINRYETAGGASISPKYYVLAKNDYAKTQEYIKTKKRNKKNTEELKSAAEQQLPDTALPQANAEQK